ncbi:MAG: hypothetical protein IPK08_05970 [Bacteroidetes bacterium]|nr:hypothetical protein [Bacteroidota bacterium]
MLVHQSFVEPVDNSNYRLTKLSLDILECGGFDEYFIKKDTESKLASQLSSSVLRTNRHMRVNMWVIAGLTGLSLWVAFMQYRRDINEELKMSLEQEKIEMQKSIEDLRLKLDSILILHHAALLKSDSTYNKK